MGEKIDLHNWPGYTGGLDTSCMLPWHNLGLLTDNCTANLTGPKSLFTKWREHNIMYHVAPMLPTDPKDPQRVCIPAPLFAARADTCR